MTMEDEYLKAISVTSTMITVMKMDVVCDAHKRLW